MALLPSCEVMYSCKCVYMCVWYYRELGWMCVWQTCVTVRRHTSITVHPVYTWITLMQKHRADHWETHDTQDQNVTNDEYRTVLSYRTAVQLISLSTSTSFCYRLSTEKANGCSKHMSLGETQLHHRKIMDVCCYYPVPVEMIRSSGINSIIKKLIRWRLTVLTYNPRWNIFVGCSVLLKWLSVCFSLCLHSCLQWGRSWHVQLICVCKNGN